MFLAFKGSSPAATTHQPALASLGPCPPAPPRTPPPNTHTQEPTVRQGDGLGVARGAGRVDERGQRVSSNGRPHKLLCERCAKVQHLVKREHGARELLPRRIRRLAPQQHNKAHAAAQGLRGQGGASVSAGGGRAAGAPATLPTSLSSTYRARQLAHQLVQRRAVLHHQRAALAVHLWGGGGGGQKARAR